MSKTAKIVIFSVIGAVIVCCGGGVGGLFFVLNSAVKAPKAAAEDFLTKLEAGNNEAAYALLCRTTQNNYDREEFDSLVQKDAPTKHDMSWGGSYSSENGLETASVTASLTHKGGWSGDHTFAMRKEDGVWKVCGDPY